MAKAYIEKEAAITTLHDTEIMGCPEWNAALKRGAEKLESIPAADVVPAVHGRWIMHINDLFPVESTMECSQCHEEQPIDRDDNYCPNCGAIMDGGQEPGKEEA